MKILPKMYNVDKKKTENLTFRKAYASGCRSRNFLKYFSSTLRYRAIFHYLARISVRTHQIFIQIFTIFGLEILNKFCISSGSGVGITPETGFA